MDKIDELIGMGKTQEQIVNILLNATKIRKLTLREIKYITDYISGLEIKARLYLASS